MAQTKVQLLQPDLGDVIDFDASTLFVDGADNRIGIRNTNPQYELDVTGTINATNFRGNISVGTVDDWIVHTGDTDTKIGFSAADTFQVYAGGGPRLTVNSTGLQVPGIVDTTVLRRQVQNSSVIIAGGNATNDGANIAMYGSAHSSQAGNFEFRSGGSYVLKIKSDGKIGINETSPEELLDLGEANSQNLKLGQRGYLGQAYSTAATILGHSVKAKTTGTTSGGMIVTETNSGGGAPSAIRQESGTIQFHTAGSGTADADFDSERLRITSAGHLLLSKTTSNWGTSTDNTVIQLENSAIWDYAGVQFDVGHNYYYNGSAYKYIRGGYAARQTFHNNDGSIAFWSGGTGSADATFTWSEKLRIDSNGMSKFTRGSTGTVGHFYANARECNILLQNDAQTWKIVNYDYGNNGTDNLGFHDGTADRLVIAKTGKIGINNTNPDYTLDVRAPSGDVWVSARGGTNQGYQVRKSDNTLIGYAGNGGGVNLGANDFAISAPNANLSLCAGGTAASHQRLRILSNGNILYGDHMNDRGAELQYEGSQHNMLGLHRNTPDHGAPSMTFSSSRGTSAGAVTIVQDDDYLGLIRFSGADGSDLASGAQITAIVDGTPASDKMPTRLAFWTSDANSQSPTERLQITKDGNIRIGSGSVDTPKASLHGVDIDSGGYTACLGGNVNSSGRTNATDKLGRITSPHRTNAEEPVAMIAAYNQTGTNTIQYGGGSSITNAATHHHFYTAANTTTLNGTERFRIENDGDTHFWDHQGDTRMEIQKDGDFKVSNPTWASSSATNSFQGLSQHGCQHWGQRQYYSGSFTLTQNGTKDLFSNNTAHDDIIFWLNIKGYHANRTFAAVMGTIGGYGITYHSQHGASGGAYTFTAANIASGRNMLRFTSTTSYGAQWWVWGWYSGTSGTGTHTGQSAKQLH